MVERKNRRKGVGKNGHRAGNSSNDNKGHNRKDANLMGSVSLKPLPIKDLF